MSRIIIANLKAKMYIIWSQMKARIQNTILIFSFLAFAVLISLSVANASKKSSDLKPVKDLIALDMPYDDGGNALLKWNVRSSDSSERVYKIYVSTVSESAGWLEAENFFADSKLSKDMPLPFWAWKSSANKHAVKIDAAKFFPELSSKTKIYFQLEEIAGENKILSPIISTTVRGNWFNLPRMNNLLFAMVLMIVFFWMVSHAKKKDLFIRRIAGLDAIDEAIGRATEMGKSIYYSPGIGTMSNMSTIASTSILGEVSKKIAKYDSAIKVPHFDPIVMSICKEIVKQSYLEAERPDSYRDDCNFFVSQDQFSYAASVDGMIHREQPAACFFIGYFMAESLLLAEVGATTGAIQIAGTDIESQLPFFFMACDYTLIGEELYAASAYLSRDPMLVSSLKVQDFGKMFVIVTATIGLILTTIGAIWNFDLLVKIANSFFEVY
ncbi:MAG: hypothetical protein L6420_06720 [Elusimicrobia bacterium]|nr:hypothetical protein [Elusimicrobiota bacterium]